MHTRTRELRPQLSSMSIRCSRGQLQRHVLMHVIELDHGCLLTGSFAISFLAFHSFLLFFRLPLPRMSWYVHDSVW